MKPILSAKVEAQLNAVVSHPSGSYLFYGSSAPLTSEAALEVARKLNCLGCNNKTCVSCKLQASGNHPDIIRILPDDKRKIGIAQVGQLRQSLGLRKQNSSKKRVVIIEKADYLTVPAQNALLKTLEEPPIDTIMILAATEKSALLPTVQSRLQTIYFPSKTDKQFATDSKVAEDFMSANYFDRLVNIPKMVKELNFEELANSLSAEIKLRARTEPDKGWLKGLAAIHSFQERLVANVTPRLALEALALELPC